MAQQPRPSAGNPFVDLVCVAVLAALLWVSAEVIGGVVRASSLHPDAPERGVAADCPPGGNKPASADPSPLASLAVTGACDDTAPKSGAH